MGGAEISIRELRNHGGEAVDRVSRGPWLSFVRFHASRSRLPCYSSAGATSRTSTPERLREDVGQHRRPVTVTDEAAIRQGLLDTSTLILLARISDPAVLPDEPLRRARRV